VSPTTLRPLAPTLSKKEGGRILKKKKLRRLYNRLYLPLFQFPTGKRKERGREFPQETKLSKVPFLLFFHPVAREKEGGRGGGREEGDQRKKKRGGKRGVFL